jgi:mRNA interferase MazF
MQPGDVVLVDFAGITGVKRRPSLVISTDDYHRQRPDTIIGVLTSQTAHIGALDYLLQDWAAAGLHQPSLFRPFLDTVPQTQIRRIVGHLTDRDWQAVRDCIRQSVCT